MQLLANGFKVFFAQNELNDQTKIHLDKIKELPNNPWPYWELGKHFLEKNKLKKAYLLFKIALNLKPDFHGFYYNLGVTSQKLENFQEAHFYYATAIALNPDNYWYYESLCQSLIGNNQIACAITYYEKALTLNQKESRIYRKLASLYLKQEDLSSAIDYYEKVIDIDPNEFDYLRLANTLVKTHKLDRAIVHYQKALELNENLQEVHQELGKALCMQGNGETGTTHYNKAKYLRSLPTNKDFLSWPDYNYLVNHEYRFVYCPIPKVACSSFKKLILQISEPENFQNIIKSLSGVQFHIHIDHAYSLFQYKKQRVDKILAGNKYFKFAFVRNPWNRLVSAYLNKFLPAEPRPVARPVIQFIYEKQGLAPNFEKSITFRQFINYLIDTDDHLLNEHWRPQYLFLGDYDFDFIGKFENITEDFQQIKQKLSLRTDLDWLNKTENLDSRNDIENQADFYPQEIRNLTKVPDYQNFYTAELVELVRERYKVDIERFDYQFS